MQMSHESRALQSLFGAGCQVYRSRNQRMPHVQEPMSSVQSVQRATWDSHARKRAMRESVKVAQVLTASHDILKTMRDLYEGALAKIDQHARIAC